MKIRKSPHRWTQKLWGDPCVFLLPNKIKTLVTNQPFKISLLLWFHWLVLKITESELVEKFYIFFFLSGLKVFLPRVSFAADTVFSCNPCSVQGWEGDPVPWKESLCCNWVDTDLCSPNAVPPISALLPFHCIPEFQSHHLVSCLGRSSSINAASQGFSSV